MISEQLEEILTERLVNRIELLNSNIIKEIGKQLKYLGTLSPSKARQIVQTLKYGGSFDKILQELVKTTNLNVNDIYSIFEEVAKRNQEFAKAYYQFKGVDFVPYSQNIALQSQVNALAKVTADSYINISRTLAFVTKDSFGNRIITNLSQTYQNAIDKAILGAIQGKNEYRSAIRSTMKELASSGIKTVDYANNKTMRLDSAVRMNIRDGIRTLTIEMQKQFGKEFGADGVEISVHTNPAKDHEPIQGHQFTNDEYAKIGEELPFTDYQGREYMPIDRHIGEWNCYHYIFSVILGVNKQTYTDKQLKEIVNNNNKGFELDGQTYTMYEGTQLQRKLEVEIRKNKDMQIALRSIDNKDEANKYQQRINFLTDKYAELSKISGLLTKKDRLTVSGYRKIKI